MATPKKAYYKHHEKATDADVRASAKTREIVLSTQGLKVIAKMNDGSFIELVRDGFKDAISYASLTAAISAIGISEVRLVISSAFTLTANLVIPSNIDVYMTRGGSIALAGYTLTVNGPFSAGLFQVFSGSGSVIFAEGVVEYIRPQWWGSTGALAKAAAAASTNGHTLEILGRTETLDANVTFAANVHWRIKKSGVIAMAGYTLSAPIPDAGNYQIFSGTGTYSWYNPHVAINPFWWGAKADGTTDDGVAIQAAFDALADYGQIDFPVPSPYYRTTTQIEVANKPALRVNFVGGGDTALPAYPTYPIKYDGPVLTGWENPVIRLIGCVRSIFNGAALDANNKADFGFLIAGMNAYAIPTVTSRTATFNPGTDVDTGAETISIPAHGFSTADPFVYSNGGGSDIGGLVSGTTYYAINQGAGSIKVASSAVNANAGTAINLTGVGTGSAHTLSMVDISADGINKVAHSFATGDTFLYSNGGGTSIGGLVSGTTYYAIRTSSSLFKVALSYSAAIAGTAINLTSVGTGLAHTFTWQPKTLTSTYRRMVGCEFHRFATKNCNVSGAQVGQESQLNSSQTDITTFFNSYFAVAESATQIALDTTPTTYGVKFVGANTYVNFDHCEFTGDYGVFGVSGSALFNHPYFLGHAGLYVNSNTLDVTMLFPYGEGFLGRPVWTASSDNTEAKNINIIGAKFFPGGKATATIDTATDVNIGTDTITEAGHPYVTGDKLVYSNGGGTSIVGLTTGTTYYAIRASANGFKLASTLENAQAGTAIDLTGTGVGSAHTFTWRPCPMRFQSNQNVTMIGCFAEDFITDNLGATGQKPVYVDLGNTWLHPTDYSGNPDLRLIRFSTFAGAGTTEWMRYMHNLLTQIVDQSAGTATLSEGWSNVDVIGVQGASGNTIVLPAAKKGMVLRVWKCGTGTLIVNKAAASGVIVRHDTDANATTSVRANSTIENGYIQFTSVEDGEWRVTSTMSLIYDNGSKYLTYSGTWDPANLAADGNATSTSVTVTDALVGDFVQVSHDQLGTNDVLLVGHVSAADTVRVVLMNKTGGALNVASGTLRVKVTRP